MLGSINRGWLCVLMAKMIPTWLVRAIKYIPCASHFDQKTKLNVARKFINSKIEFVESYKTHSVSSVHLISIGKHFQKLVQLHPNLSFTGAYTKYSEIFTYYSNFKRCIHCNDVHTNLQFAEWEEKEEVLVFNFSWSENQRLNKSRDLCVPSFSWSASLIFMYSGEAGDWTLNRASLKVHRNLLYECCF